MEFQHSQQEKKPEAMCKKKKKSVIQTKQSKLTKFLWISSLSHVLPWMEVRSPGMNCFSLASSPRHLSGSA